MNNPFDYVPDKECEEAFRKLLTQLDRLKGSDNQDDIDFCRELEAGKMLGVLIAADFNGMHHTLYAFSGQLGKAGFHFPGFVEPVFDYLQPGGYFKTKEAEITILNFEITHFEEGDLAEIKDEYERTKTKLNAGVAKYKEKILLSKSERKAKREAGVTDEAELAAMIRQSQFEKAELHRLKKKMAAELKPYATRLMEAEAHLREKKDKRGEESEALQQWLFANFSVLNARGESRSLSDIFADTSLKVPPSGAGECCAPKLLQAAYIRKLTPLFMAEYWYGRPKGGQIRKHGNHYPACRGKCLPVLSWMLRGLHVTPPITSESLATETDDPKIIYENRWFCVVDKPAGMLSVPGKGNAVSVEKWLSDKYGVERKVRMAHRLDQATSGLIVATFGDEAFKIMQSLFARRKVIKTYVAELEGDYHSFGIAQRGRIDLPLSPDWFDRPRQRVDYDNGKEAETEYEFIGFSEGRSRIIFHPLTGRTHQLRVHSASEGGLGMPIAGDRLYGKAHSDGRLLLHAHKIEFIFPLDGNLYNFQSPVPF